MQTKQHIARVALNAPQDGQKQSSAHTVQQEKFSYPLPLGLYVISIFAIVESVITIVTVAAGGEFTMSMLIGVIMLSIGWGLLRLSRIAYIAAQVVLILMILACMFVLGILVQESSFEVYGFSIISTAASINSMRGLIASIVLSVGVIIWIITYLRSPMIKNLFTKKS